LVTHFVKWDARKTGQKFLKKTLTKTGAFEKLAPHTVTNEINMRTKTLLLTAALAVGAATSSMAQVFSQNVVGYVNVTVTNGQFLAVANPLNNGTNTLDEILPNAPANTTVVYEFTPSGFVTYTKRANWGATAAGRPFGPGKGFFVQNTGTTPTTLTFVGEVPEGTKTVAIASGFNLISSAFPLSGAVETGLGLPAVNANVIFQWAPSVQNYVQYTRRAANWTPNEPTIGVGEGFFFQAQAATNWTKTYTVPRP
jgi:hypothetical protein